MGFDHAEVGAKLLEHWQLPEGLWIPIRYHHHPAQAQSFSLEASVIHIANVVAHWVEINHAVDLSDIKQQLPLIDSQALALVTVSEANLNQAVEEANMELFEVMDLMIPGFSCIF